MAQDAKDKVFPQPAAVTALRQESGLGHVAHKIMMERTFSQDIQEGTQELKQAAEQTRNIILDLSLDGVIRWVSPSWTDVVGTKLDSVKGKAISSFITDHPNIFEEAIDTLKKNDAKSQFVKFAVDATPASSLGPMIPSSAKPLSGEIVEQTTEELNNAKHRLELEGQGIMVYDRATGGESHTMWMLQPATEPVHITIALPQALVEKLGVGAEVLAKHLNELAGEGTRDPANHPPPLPIVCRVCERSINPWWFEKHSDLCVQEHRAELEIQMIQETLSEHRHAIVKVLDAFESRTSRAGAADQSPSLSPAPEYKGLPIGPSPHATSTTSSARASKAASPARSRSPSANRTFGHARMRSSFLVRRPLVRIIELILDLCDTALEINVPAVKEIHNGEDFRTQSPQSESRVSQVVQWQQPSSLENEPGLNALSLDTERLAKSKVEAVHRHMVILEYSERIRQEYMTEVEDCIAEALDKAERAAAGESLSSSESESDIPTDEFEEETPQMRDTIPELAEPEAEHELELPTEPVRPKLRSMASALRNPLELPPVLPEDILRPQSQAVSSGSASPMECPTPRSHISNLVQQPQPISKRRSIYATEADDSDSSLPSNSVLSSVWRPDSAASSSDQGLSRQTTRDRRKRRSMHLHSLRSDSPQRQQSPAQYSQAPASPMRISKARLPSGELSGSPVVSPLLTGHDMLSSSPTLHHRRQSSIHPSDLRTPLSPRLGHMNLPQVKAMPPSIKDFEIIKPISKGAFGSVYLAKKKLTGEYFAVKVLRKNDMVAKNQVTNVKAERAIMMWQGESDFVAKLYWTFSSKEYLFLVMEYLNGGDCASLVKILGGLSEDWAKKYVAEVVLGVEHLHSRGIVHRDLKPDNLLIDSKGHLKLTDFGLSRMGLIGRQKRALKSPEDPTPDLLKQGPFATQNSGPPSRSASFDYQNASESPAQTPLMTPALAGGLDQPSYFNLNRESTLSRELSRHGSGYRSDSGSPSSHDLHAVFKNMSISESGDFSRPSSYARHTLPDEEIHSQGSNSPDLYPLSQSISHISQMLPPPTALFDPEESHRRFVGTPDYLAPETITGTVQDEMCDWWSLGCILFEFMFGYPPFNAETTSEVFDNILNRRIAWPDEEDMDCSPEAKDLINKLIQIDPRRRLGANAEDKYRSGGAEIQAHSWFADINWTTLLEDEAQFIPNPENPEDTEYFDSRGAVLQSFPEENEDSLSPGFNPPSIPGSEYPDRPHDALFRARTQTISNKRGLMPLHIPPHVARDSRSRRLSEPVIADDFGDFTFKNLPVLEKANKDIVDKMRKEAMQAQARGALNSQAVSVSNTPAAGSPVPSLENSPMLPMPVKRALSISKHRPASPSSLAINSHSSPCRPSQPSSPLLLQFSTLHHGHSHGYGHHERRKTSGSSAASSLQPSFFDLTQSALADHSAASSPVKNPRLPAISPAKPTQPPQRQSSTSTSGRSRSQTVGSHDSGDVAPNRDIFVPGHHKRRSQLIVRDVSPSSSDNESSAQAKALLKVQKKRQSARRMSQYNLLAGPQYRPLDILVCEDHPVSKMVMERLLEKLRCRSITATTGSDVLRLAVSQLQFDIIFMEFKLPLINGVDVARMIRDTKSANTNTPIVCITGYLKDLPEIHNFDSLIQKPPTLEKLTEALCKYCSWKPPPKDFKQTLPLTIPQNIPRPDAVQDSPSSVASSRAPPLTESSWKGSSRGDSISSGFFSEPDFLRGDDIPVIVSRATTDDWHKEGLGISNELINSQKPYIHTGFPHLIQTESAPASTVNEEPPTGMLQTPKPRQSSEDLHAKRGSRKAGRSAGAEEGDDEDEELGHIQVRARSPPSKNIRPTSKLGYEMMRTNSRGSVILSNEERSADSESLRRSLEILEERMGTLAIPEEDALPPNAVQPRKTSDELAIASHLDATNVGATGHITPPVIFPQKPGTAVTEVNMDEQITPMPPRIVNIEEETPRPTKS